MKYIVNAVALQETYIFPRLCRTKVCDTREEAEEAAKRFLYDDWDWLREDPENDYDPKYGEGDDNITVLYADEYLFTISIIEVEV